MNKRSNSYTRLIDACHTLRSWKTPTEISRELTLLGYPVSVQQMSNWKAQGWIAKRAIIPISGRLGIRPAWLEEGELPMAGTADFAHITMLGRRVRKSVKTLCDIAEKLDECAVGILIGRAEALAETNQIKQKGRHVR